MAPGTLPESSKSSLADRLRYWIFSGGVPVDSVPHAGPTYMEAIAAKGCERDDEYFGQLPDTIPASKVRELSVISPVRTVFYIALNWLYVAGAIWGCVRFWHPALYVLTVLFLGARFHGMMMLMHDGAHYRLFHNKRVNDAVCDLFLDWPFFISLPRYRTFHFLHHHHLGDERDGNRVVYLTHTAQGDLTSDWRYPKSAGQFLFLLLKRFLAGPLLAVYIVWINLTEAVLVWIGQPQKAWLIGGYRKPPSRLYVTLHVAFMAAAFTAIAYLQAWRGFLLFWVMPWSWHVVLEQIRITSEHFSIGNSHPFYGETRTIKVSWLERLFYLPNNGTYHLEHHMYPSVPFYRLRELHSLLMQQPGFRGHAQITNHLTGLFRELHGAAAKSKPQAA